MYMQICTNYMTKKKITDLSFIKELVRLHEEILVTNHHKKNPVNNYLEGPLSKE
jgi:hypothetical protein